MYPKSLSALLLLADLLSCHAAWAQQPVTYVLDGHARGATDRRTIYAATCQQKHYQLLLDEDRSTLQFTYDAGQPSTTELSATPFGQVLLTKSLVGKFGFSCAADGLNVSFIGFHLQRSMAPQPVGYRLTIANNGEVLEDNGLTLETIDFVNTYLGKK